MRKVTVQFGDGTRVEGLRWPKSDTHDEVRVLVHGSWLSAGEWHKDVIARDRPLLL